MKTGVYAVLFISQIIFFSYQSFPQTNPVPVATFEREEIGGGFFGGSMDYGDINGDGVNDLIVSDRAFTNQYGLSAGRVYVFYGGQFSGNISASMADIMIDGIQENHCAAYLACGNIDGDEYADLVLGTPWYTDTVNWYDHLGRVYVFYGKNLITKNHFTLHEADQFFYGDTVMKEINIATMFDFDGDGLDDVFINSYARGYGGGIYIGQNRLNVFYAKNILNDDSVDVRNPDLYFYGYDPSQIYNGFLGLSKGLRFVDLNNDNIKDLVLLYAKAQSPDLDTISIFFGQHEGRYGAFNYNEGDILILLGYDYGGYRQAVHPYFCNYDGKSTYNISSCNTFFHLDPEYNNQYGRIYLFGDSLYNGMTLQSAQTHITGTIAGIWSGNFGRSFSSGDMNSDGKDDFAVGSYGWGGVGNQYLFKGNDQFPDSMVDNDADVKIIGNSQFSELHNGSMIADIMGAGRPQLLVCYSRNGSRVNGFVNLYSSSILVGVDDPETDKPSKVELYPNYPNPFNPSTTIRYYLPKNEKVELKIFNILGQEVKTLVSAVQPQGEHKIIWNGINKRGQSVSSGVYVYRLKAGSSVLTKKMILLR